MSAVAKAPSKPTLDDLESALITVADLLEAAHDLFQEAASYPGDRQKCEMSGRVANQVFAILRAGRDYARAELGEDAR